MLRAGGFGAGAFFSGGGGLRSSSPSRWTGWISRPGVALVILCFPSDPRWRWIWRRTDRDLRRLPAMASTAAAAKWSGWDRGALPRPFIVNNSGAARRRVKAASSIGKKLSLTAARWWLAAFDSDAGDGVFFDLWSVSPMYFVLVFPTVYGVCGMC